VCSAARLSTPLTQTPYWTVTLSPPPPTTTGIVLPPRKRRYEDAVAAQQTSRTHSYSRADGRRGCDGSKNDAPMWAYYEHAVVAAAAAAVVNDSATPPLIIDEDVDAAEETDKVFEDLGEHSCTASFEEALSVLSQVA